MTTDRTSQAGRNRVGAKALRSVAVVVTAEAMGVTARDVAVDLLDDDGLLGVSATTAIALPSLLSPQRATPTALERSEWAQSTIRDRMREITGASVGLVDLRLTRARTITEGKVR